MMHTGGGGGGQGFTLSNLMGDGQVQVFGKILEGEKMTANGHGGTPESLGENEGLWEGTCKYKLHI